MDNLIFSLNATLPVFIIMMVGWGFRRCGIISESFASQMNKFVFKIALPVSLFTQLYDVNISEVWDTGYVVFCFLATLASILLAALVARFCAEKSDRAEFVQGAYRSSASLLGMAYIELIYGKATMGSLMMIGCVPLYNVAAVIILSGGSSGKSESNLSQSVPADNHGDASASSPESIEESIETTGSSAEISDNFPGGSSGKSSGKLPGSTPRNEILHTLRGIITNPIILGIVIGFLWSLTGLGLPQFLATSCNYIGRLASPMGLLSMGAALDFGKMGGKLRPALVGTFLKLVGFAAVFIPIAVRLGFTGEKLVAALIMLGSPSTVAGYIMAKNMGHEGTLSASMVMISTVVSSLTLTLWLWLLRSRGLV